MAEKVTGKSARRRRRRRRRTKMASAYRETRLLPAGRLFLFFLDRLEEATAEKRCMHAPEILRQIRHAFSRARAIGVTLFPRRFFDNY